ncbi:hypothetical protein PUR34_06665 [Streptomyces sp. JV185]|uniref:hypothetical protein n=1 Tax=Streptomyces sp. JV185 TaxID=858638 RepID=UPI002E77A4B6|nr:hypothetical protein [Streptomyces sp. JV185]MEE1767871.1 hypothetical protein [Streptomyces sp. JV185]
MEPKDTISDGPAPEGGPAPRPQPVPGTLAAPVAEPVTAPEVEPVAAPVAAPVAKRPRGRTALIVLAAAVLGIAGGTAVGYDVQAKRAPTPLPALSQPGLAYPAKALPPGKAPDPLPASQDHRVRTDGDLRKLIADRPAGWSDDDNSVLNFGDGWLDVDAYARSYKEEGSMYEYFLQAGIRRVASAAWKRGEHRTTETYLVQFGSTTFQGAKNFAEGQLRYMPGAEIGAGYNGGVIKGSGNGRYCVYEVERKPGYLPSYHARATVYRGDIVADVHLYDTSPISKKDIRTLAERQLERL